MALALSFVSPKTTLYISHYLRVLEAMGGHYQLARRSASVSLGGLVDALSLIACGLALRIMMFPESSRLYILIFNDDFESTSMSHKTSHLLHRSGRNQFGDPGDPPLPPYEPSAEQLARDKEMVTLHRALNEKFVQAHKARWLELFSGLSKAQAWSKLHPYGKPALGTFYSMAREFNTFEQFLLWWLVSNKTQALRRLGHEDSSIHEQLRTFSDCGRYHVTYGSCARIFGTDSQGD